MKLVIADDSGIVLDRLSELIDEVPGVELAGRATSAKEAIHLIDSLNPDVAVLDMQMPDGTGLDVLLAVRQKRADRTFIILTNLPYPQYRERCLRAGAGFFLDKSADFEKIPVILNTIMHVPAKSVT